MSEIIERQPPAKALIFGIRAIGYSFSTAVADIIDNSISATATRIDVLSDPKEEASYFEIIDNGFGMDKSELINAMLLGSDRESKLDCELELGRFGLGLKSASLSQCREFIVISKQNSEVNAISFDLDLIETTNKWKLKILSSDEIGVIPNIEYLMQYNSGTMIYWSKFDKIEGLAKNFEDSFRLAIADAKKHVELVFHRFYDLVEMFFNFRRIDERDPFLKKSVGRQQTGHTTYIELGDDKIQVTPYTLPYANSLLDEEKALLGNPKSVYDDQGFYLYRNKRLITWGSWLRMNYKSELNKLARVQVDIPSTLDEVWMLDVKKSSAKIPDKIKDELKASVNDSVIRSKRTTRFPGVKEQSIINKIWDKIDEHEGKIRYQINRQNPVVSSLYEAIGINEKKIMDIMLSQLECYIPKYSIINDNAESLKILNSGDDIEEERLIEELIGIISIADEEKREKKLIELLSIEAYQKLSKRKDEIFERVLSYEQ